jgi:hypothetical protein
MKLSQLLNQSTDHLDFWDKLETAGGRLLFEEYVAMYLKATLPGQTYWLGEEVVPPHIAEIHNFSKILKGARSIGADMVNVNGTEVVAYESKWFDHKETIRFAPVANKLQVIRKTGIDRLIFTTNARKASDQVLEFAEEAGFMFQSEWITAEVFQTVKDYINLQKKKIYSPMRPRDEFFQNALDELNVDFTKKFLNTSLAKIQTRIFQHWPAASGKGSFPRLAYDMIFEPRWNYKKAYPINTIVNPTLVVLKGNLIKQIQHDQGLGNKDVIHVIYAGDVTKSANTEELQSIRAMAKVFTKKIDFVKFLRETQNKTIWVHTTVHSYDALARTMRAQKKKFFFGHIDEVHHMIQPDYSTWTSPLNDQACEIQIRLMSSANRRKARGTGCSYSMDASDFCDTLVKELDEKTAVALGYKRRTVILNYLYDQDNFPTTWLERFENNNQPMIRLKDTGLVVPLSWFMAADSLIRFRVEYSERNHTKLTLNSIPDCKKFAEFFEAILPRILKSIPDLRSQSTIYRRLLKAKIMVADTHNNSTVKLLKEVSSIPDIYEDSFIVHCRLLGEGWDPANGWVDSGMFISSTWSEIRIYQDVNRGSRIGDGSKSINYMIMFGLKDPENHFNEMFRNIKKVGETLEIGMEEITERVIFKEFRSTPKGRALSRQAGSTQDTNHDEFDADFIAQAFKNYIKEGRYSIFGEMVNDIARDWIRLDRELGTYLPKKHTSELFKAIVNKYQEFFGQYKRYHGQIGLITSGEHTLLSDEMSMAMIDWQIKRQELHKQAQEDIENIVKEYFPKQLHPHSSLCLFYKIITDKYPSLDTHHAGRIAGNVIETIRNDQRHWDQQLLKVINHLITIAPQHNLKTTWAQACFDDFDKLGILKHGIGAFAVQDRIIRLNIKNTLKAQDLKKFKETIEALEKRSYDHRFKEKRKIRDEKKLLPKSPKKSRKGQKRDIAIVDKIAEANGRKVKTPQGIFRSIRQAFEVTGVSENKIVRKATKKIEGYEFI